jgi:hypothetical protein
MTALVELALGRIRVLELEGHNEKARAERGAFHRAIGWCGRGTDEDRRISEGRCGEGDEQNSTEQRSDESHTE